MEGPRLYAWIVFLSEGPITWRELPTKGAGKDPKTTGRAYRIVQPVSEIYDTILLEGVIIGNEGCCKKVRKVAQVDLEGFAKALGFNGEIGEFEFVKWEPETPFRFRFKEREFIAAGLGRSKLNASEAPASDATSESTLPGNSTEPRP